jgi:hypothetical protein
LHARRKGPGFRHAGKKEGKNREARSKKQEARRKKQGARIKKKKARSENQGPRIAKVLGARIRNQGPGLGQREARGAKKEAHWELYTLLGLAPKSHRLLFLLFSSFCLLVLAPALLALASYRLTSRLLLLVLACWFSFVGPWSLVLAS